MCLSWGTELFNSTANPMLQSFMDGYNVTIIAYGQTGSGKTFTMGSESGSSHETMVVGLCVFACREVMSKPFIRSLLFRARRV